MTPAPPPQPQLRQQHPDWLVRFGGRLFTWRTSLPVPLALVLLLIPSEAASSRVFLWLGPALVLAGELLRLWAVRQIGVISRTRSERLGPLVTTGPFARVRNPLYIGNIALWAGFSLSAGLPWLTPIVIGILGLVYHAIVRWEEGLLEARLGDSYRLYAAHVPRWVPSTVSPPMPINGKLFSWRDTFFSERGTLIAIAVGYGLLGIKNLGI